VSAFADRIRAIVSPGSASSRPALPPPPASTDETSIPALEEVLGGRWDGESSRCFVIERRLERSYRHGRETIEILAGRLEQGSAHAPLFAGGSACWPFLFLDLETTGLNGGAGTVAFLAGCGWFDEDGAFVTKQFLMTSHAHERRLLQLVTGEIARAGAVVSFNGKSFDAPLLESRCLFHRMAWVGERVAHLDTLHAARRFWPGDCSLVTLERQTVGARRTGDVPGAEIPARYFHFVRSGDARPLAAVAEHNRLDLLTLAALTARLLHLACDGVDAVRDGREAYALGITYARAGLDDRAVECYTRAIESSPAPAGAFDPLRMESLRALALVLRRTRRYDRAADCWRRLLETRGCPPPIRREAAEALAIHHEHRVRDLVAARTFALRSLAEQPRPAWTEAVQYRVARIERKMNAGRLL